MTLAAITDCYGSLPGFADYVDVRKRLAEIAKLERQNEEAKGLLIERELVRVHVFGLIEGVFRRLLTDSPKTIARLVYAEAKADRPVEDAEKLVRKQVSAQLKTLKAKAGKALNGSVADGESGEPATS